MTKDEAKTEIKIRWRELMPAITPGPAKQKVNGETSWICPVCKTHGTHGDGLTLNRASADGTGLKCFGCGFSGDVISLYQEAEHKSYNQAVNDLAAILGISIDDESAPEYAGNASKTRQKAAGATAGGNNASAGGNASKGPLNAENGNPSSEAADYTAYYRQCAERLEDAAEYLSERGISLETARRFMIGYDPAADPAGNPGGTGESKYPCNRLIIPVTKGYYVGRRTDGGAEYKYKKMGPKGASPGIFNAACLYRQDADIVFVTEGAIDALSVIEAGRQAIALNSTSNAARFIDALKQRPTAATLVICMDNDAPEKLAAKKATEILTTGLTRLNISCVAADINGSYKDANEHLTGNRAEFVAAVADAARKAGKRPDNTADYIRDFMTADIERFREQRLTGFKEFDRITGGLYPGLYILAASPSLGKTTYIHQMAEQIAAAGNECLFFSLEMSALEMVSKSLARRIAMENPHTQVTSLSIRKGYNQNKRETAAAAYIADVGDRLSVIEGDFKCDISFICEYVRNYARRNDVKPVVFVDYLQIVQPAPETAGNKILRETIDEILVTLKRLSRELSLTIFVVSSLNRQNYNVEFDFASTKESGGIEYTADVVLGMQLQCIHTDDVFDQDADKKISKKREAIAKAKKATPRKVELVCRKNRYGIADFSINYDYYPANDLFVEEGEFQPVPKDWDTPF